jgi:hypothetical protein
MKEADRLALLAAAAAAEAADLAQLAASPSEGAQLAASPSEGRAAAAAAADGEGEGEVVKTTRGVTARGRGYTAADDVPLADEAFTGVPDDLQQELVHNWKGRHRSVLTLSMHIVSLLTGRASTGRSPCCAAP